MLKLEAIINEFIKFDDSVFEKYLPTDENSIVTFENSINNRLPLDFKNFLLISNGALINCHELYGIDSRNKNRDLFDNFIFETREAGNAMPNYYLPIYPDGMGNHNCLDLSSLSSDKMKCNVIFWQHDRQYSENEKPDIDAESFIQFLENMLEELTKNYNWDGTEK